MTDINTGTEQEIGAFFDKCANNGLMAEFDEAEKKKLARFLGMWNIRPGDRILEPGCGTGRLTEILAGIVGKDGAVVASDLSGEMIARAKKRGLPPWVRVDCASFHPVPVEDGYFDIVLCFQVFPHFNDRRRALAEIRRVIKPGGTLWIAHLSSRAAINTLHHNAGDVVVSHMIPDEIEMRNLLAGEGFTVKMIQDSPEGYMVQAIAE